MKNHYELLKKHFFNTLDRLLQINDIHNDPARCEIYLFTAGGDQGLTDGYDFCYYVPYFMLGYYLEESPHYRDPDLMERAYAALCRYETYIHEDGTDDLLCTNFHDPAQTGFHVHALYSAVELLARFTAHTEKEDRVFEKCKELLRRSGHAMATLGFHTPNHRWVISSALTLAYRYTGEQEFLDAINGFLREGVDCDEYGEYTERSTGSYNNICNYSFMLMGYFLENDEFYEYPRRNLNLVYHFIEPDHTVNTLNSSRWDNGGDFTVAPYYPHYLLLALMDENPEFAYMADMLYDRYHEMAFASRLPFLLTVLTLEPELAAKYAKITSKAPEKDQTCFLPNSRIARIYQPDKALTMTALCSRHPVFFQMNYGSSILQLRFAGSFFGDPHSQFRARSITPTADGYRLVCEESAGYRSQLEEKPETSNWRRMDHSKRQIINVQTFRTEITIHLLEDGATFEIETSGCERIPTKLEVGMRPGGKLFTESLVVLPKAGDYLFLNHGGARYFIDGSRYFEIEGGFCEHLNAEHMRGTAPANPRNFTIAMTTTTPQKSTVTIRAKDLFRQ